MSKHYDEVWSLIEKLDDINARLTDMLDAEEIAMPVPIWA